MGGGFQTVMPKIELVGETDDGKIQIWRQGSDWFATKGEWAREAKVYQSQTKKRKGVTNK